ncbi:hypothetical protein Tco_1320836 [Tanacetum coccineum]
MLINEVYSPSELLEKNYSSNTSVKLALAKLDKYSGDAGMSKDMLGLEKPRELRRRWYFKGHVKSRVISSILAQRYQRTTRQRPSPTMTTNATGDKGPLPQRGCASSLAAPQRARWLLHG